MILADQTENANSDIFIIIIRSSSSSNLNYYWEYMIIYDLG